MSTSTRQIQIPRIQTRKTTTAKVHIEMSANNNNARKTRASTRKATEVADQPVSKDKNLSRGVIIVFIYFKYRPLTAD